MTAALTDTGTVTIIRDSNTASRTDQVTSPPGPQMTLSTESGSVSYAVDIAPRDISYGGLAYDWAQAERSGTTPLLLHEGAPLLTMTFSFLITDKRDMYAPQTAKIDKLKTLARHQQRLLCKYGPMEQGVWRMTDLKIDAELRVPGTNAISRATASVTLTQASDAAPAVGPVLKTPPPPPPAPKKTPPRIYIVLRGDCLWNIARKFYGPTAGAAWPKIFDANRSKIKNPSLIYVGQVFIIP